MRYLILAAHPAGPLAPQAEPHATLVEPDRLAVVMLRAGLVLCALARFARSNTFVNVSSFDQLQNAVFEVERYARANEPIGEVIRITSSFDWVDTIEVRGFTLTITADETAKPVLNRKNKNRFFVVQNGGELIVSGLTFIKGKHRTYETKQANAGWGGVVYANGRESKAIFTDCTFKKNFAKALGGVAYVEGKATFKRCKFRNNRAGCGAPNIFQAKGAEVNAEDGDVGTVNECDAFYAGWIIGPMVLMACWMKCSERCNIGLPDETRVMGVHVGDMTCDIIFILVGLSFLVAHWGGSMHSGFDIAGGCIFGVGALDLIRRVYEAAVARRAAARRRACQRDARRSLATGATAQPRAPMPQPHVPPPQPAGAPVNAMPGAVSFDEMMRTIRRELVLSENMSTSSALSSACEQLGLPSDGTLEQKAARCYKDLSLADVDVVISSHHDTDAAGGLGGDRRGAAAADTLKAARAAAEIEDVEAARNEPATWAEWYDATLRACWAPPPSAAEPPVG